MCEKICKNCVWIAKLKHNFKVGPGWEESHCCTNCFEGKDGFILEVKLTDTCEEFFQKIDANELIRKYK